MRKLIILSVSFWTILLWVPFDKFVNWTQPGKIQLKNDRPTHAIAKGYEFKSCNDGGTLSQSRSDATGYIIGEFPEDAPNHVKTLRHVWPFYTLCFRELQLRVHSDVKQLICNILFANDIGGTVWDYNRTFYSIQPETSQIKSAIYRINQHIDEGYDPTLEFISSVLDC